MSKGDLLSSPEEVLWSKRNSLDDESVDSVEVTIDSNEINELTLLSGKTFQMKLVTHFDILYVKNQIKWPRRT